MKSRHIPKYLPFLVKITKEMCQTGEFPRTLKQGWTRPKTAYEIGARVALAPDCPKELRRKVERTIKAANSNWGQICHTMNAEWGRGEPDAFYMVSDRVMYCTQDAADPGLEKVYKFRGTQVEGFKNSANVGRRPGQEHLIVMQELLAPPKEW